MNIFNIDDVALLLVIFQSFLLGSLLLIINHGKKVSRRLLSVFLFAIGFDALDTLLFWNSEIKTKVFFDAIYIFYIFKFSVFLTAPTLFLYIKSILYADFSLSKKDFLHFIPLCLFPFFLWGLVATLGENQMHRALIEYGLLFQSPLFQLYLWTRHALYLGYGVAGLILILRYRERLKQGYSNIENIDQSWLMILAYGFLAIWLGVFSSYIGHKVFNSFPFSNAMGVIGNYLNFIFINAIVVYSLVKSNIFQGIKEEKELKEEIDSDTVLEEDIQFLEEDIQRLEKSMAIDLLYLEPELTLEQLANHTGISTRQISTIVNRRFNKNFFEFVNDYRVAKAKELLEITDKPIPMLDVMADAGFNSKSTFNRFFKKATGTTPTEYRKSK